MSLKMRSMRAGELRIAKAGGIRSRCEPRDFYSFTAPVSAET